MKDATSISPEAPTNRGLDYVYLRARGIRIVQRLASDIWTDYNEHDPGVTTLEQLCYALTELSYRAELPLTDLFADRNGDIRPRRHGMFIARRILPCNSVTANDYRKLITDKVPLVRNVWLNPRIPSQGSDEVNGLYDILVYTPEADDDSHDRQLRPHEILEKVRRVYSRHRNLCEDVHSVRMLSPLRTVVHANVGIGQRDNADLVLANILFALGNLLAPEVRRRPLDALLNAGETAGEIFDGPLLLRGFIQDQELQAKASSIGLNEIIRTIAGVKGVMNVRDVVVETGRHGETYRGNASIPVSPEKFLRLDSRAHPHGQGFTIRLFRNGKACNPDPERVERELDLLWMGYRRSYPLAVQYREYFGVPSGHWHDLEHYYSVQNQYPDLYGIGTFGLPADSTTERRAQARQFKGYLLPFEQLMANYLAQLAHVGDLFSIAPPDWRTYYCQSLAKTVPDVAPLLATDYERGLNEIVSSGDQIVERRNRFLEFLLSLYANELRPDRDGRSRSKDSSNRDDPPEHESLLRARLTFLRLLVSATRARGRAFDYLAVPSRRNFAGMEIKCRIEIGIDVESHRSFGELLEESEFVIAVEETEASVRRMNNSEAERIEHRFRPVLSFPTPPVVPDRPRVLTRSSVTEELLSRASDIGNLYVGTIHEEQTTVLVCKTADGGWILISVHTSVDIAVVEAHSLCRHVRPIHRARTQLYIVEHNLLRLGRRPSRKKDPFVYSFTLTAVVSLPSEERMDSDSRTMVEEIIRENTPSDTVAQVCFLDPNSLLRFESLNHAWRMALHKGRGISVALTSARLRLFLERHRHTTSTPRI